jgi:replicative DNA helicase
MNQNEQRHIPPQALDAEMSVLGAVFVDNHAITCALEVVTPFPCC